MAPIRVLQVMPAMDAGGMETFVMNVYRTIDRDKVQFDFLYHYDKPCFFDDEICTLGGNIYKMTVRQDNNLPRYLRELREAAGSQLRHTSYDAAPVESYAQAHINVLEQREITYTVPVDEALAAHIARMTPMLADVDRDKLDLSGIYSITIDENMIVGTLKESEE